MWSSLLEAVRRRRSPPKERLAEAGVARGTRVVDIGAGYGYFAFAAAEMVGDGGMVYAVEPNPRRAAEISRRAEDRETENMAVLVVGAENLASIPSGEIDVAISMSSFHHFADPQKALGEIERVVKPGGTIYIRDIKAGRIFKHGSDGPAFRRAISMRFPKAEFEEGSGYLVAKVRV